MNAVRRGALVVIGLLAAFFGLAFVTLVLRYAPLWGTRESLFAMIYTSFTFACFGAAVVAFFPRENTAEFVTGVELLLGAGYGLGGAYYFLMFLLGGGTMEVYLGLVLLVGMVIQFVLAGGFKLSTRRLPTKSTRDPSST